MVIALPRARIKAGEHMLPRLMAILGSFTLGLTTAYQPIHKESLGLNAGAGGGVAEKLEGAVRYSATINLLIFGLYVIFAIGLGIMARFDKGPREWWPKPQAHTAHTPEWVKRWVPEAVLRRVFFVTRLLGGAGEWLTFGMAGALAGSSDPAVGGNPGVIATLLLIAPVYVGFILLFTRWGKMSSKHRRNRILVIVFTAIGVCILSGDEIIHGGVPTFSLSVTLAAIAGFLGAVNVGSMRALEKRGVPVHQDLLTYTVLAMCLFGGLAYFVGLQSLVLNWLLVIVVVPGVTSKFFLLICHRLYHDAQASTTLVLVCTAVASAAVFYIASGKVPSGWEIVGMLWLFAISRISVGEDLAEEAGEAAH